MRCLLAACLAVGLIVACVPRIEAKPPTSSNRIVVAYNVPGLGTGLHLSSAVVASIYLGQITHWDDPRIAKLNPGTKLSNTPIVPFHRTDSCALTATFTAYLSAANARWKKTVGSGKTVKWPLGQGGKGNPGMTAQIKQTVGGCGYVTSSYANQHNMTYATLPTPKFISPAQVSPTHALHPSGRPSRK